MTDQHVPEIAYDPGGQYQILGECPHCRLPIYVRDDRESISLPPGTAHALYHAGCAYRRKVRYWQDRAQECVRELRKLHVEVLFELRIPVS